MHLYICAGAGGDPRQTAANTTALKSLRPMSTPEGENTMTDPPRGRSREKPVLSRLSEVRGNSGRFRSKWTREWARRQGFHWLSMQLRRRYLRTLLNGSAIGWLGESAQRAANTPPICRRYDAPAATRTAARTDPARLGRWPRPCGAL